MSFSAYDLQTLDIAVLSDETMRVFEAEHENAICTLVMNSENYVIFAACLAQSLADVHMCESVDIVFLCADIDSESVTLLRHYGTVLLLPKIEFAVKNKWPRLEENYHWLSSCFTKLYCFTLTQYKKVLFLDSDMLCRRNFAQIFDLQVPFGFLAVKQKEGVATGNIVETPNLLDALLHGYGISGAFFCIRPSARQFHSLLDNLRTNLNRACDPQVDGKSFNAGPDETLLSMQISGWRQVSRQFCCVPWLAHRFEAGEFALQGGSNKYDGDLVNRRVFLLHYASEKPWQSVQQARKEGKKIWEDVKLFFDVEKQVQQRVQDLSIQWIEAPAEDEYYTRIECDEIYDQDYRRAYDRPRKQSNADTRQ